ncbi:MAG TPA: glycosyltransferase family 2 protein [Burkholderiales bacterium]|nr:glycosyltransferase family 2 protein [Burkholderiales bacterium]
MPRAAPIVLFVHKRPMHARRVLESLLRQPLAASSPLTVYCDGARSPEEEGAVREARAVVRSLAPAQARIVERERNLGLAASIIGGVSEAIDAHGEAIVLEDDLELAPAALEYFNAALQRYRAEERAMHVSGYMYPVRAALPESFFYREATCWGWATWARAWRHFEPDARRIRDAVQARGATRYFDVDGSAEFSVMLDRQIAGQLDSWAIRWYGSLWLRGGLALHPGKSLVRNTGFDGSGVHSGSSRAYDVGLWTGSVTRFPDRVEEEPAALPAMVAYRRRVSRLHALESLGQRVRSWLS